MGEQLSGSVGNVHPNSPWRKGTPDPANKAADQKKVIGILAQIPGASGGMAESWGSPPQPGPDGSCVDELADAIWNFQSFWKANGTFKNIDGVVDPGGNTLRVLNSCVLGAEIKSAGPNGLLPANAPSLEKLATAIRGLVPYPSRWKLDNAPGVGAGGGDFSVGLGQLDVSEDDPSRPPRYMTFISGGMAISKSAVDTPITFSASTRDMPSATSIKQLSGMGRIFSRLGSLEFEDMLGPMIICTISGAAPSTFLSDSLTVLTGKQSMTGMSMTLFFLNATPGDGGPMALLQPDVLALGKAAARSKAVCMSAGACVGFDVSVGISIGAAMVDRKRDFFDSLAPAGLKQTSAADPYIKQVQDGTNSILDKLKSWSPF